MRTKSSRSIRFWISPVWLLSFVGWGAVERVCSSSLSITLIIAISFAGSVMVNVPSQCPTGTLLQRRHSPVLVFNSSFGGLQFQFSLFSFEPFNCLRSRGPASYHRTQFGCERVRGAVWGLNFCLTHCQFFLFRWRFNPPTEINRRERRQTAPQRQLKQSSPAVGSIYGQVKVSGYFPNLSSPLTLSPRGGNHAGIVLSEHRTK